MPRIDKYEPHVGGFRAPLAAAVLVANKQTAYAVGLDVDGHVVLGAGVTGILGVLIANEARSIGEVVDVMTSGEIVDWTIDGTAAGAAASPGDIFYGANSDGDIATTGDKAIGFTVEGTRLIVRVATGVTIDALV